jgi:hypothetical protein
MLPAKQGTYSSESTCKKERASVGAKLNSHQYHSAELNGVWPMNRFTWPIDPASWAFCAGTWPWASAVVPTTYGPIWPYFCYRPNQVHTKKTAEPLIWTFPKTKQREAEKAAATLAGRRRRARGIPNCDSCSPGGSPTHSASPPAGLFLMPFSSSDTFADWNLRDWFSFCKLRATWTTSGWLLVSDAWRFVPWYAGF